MINNNFGYGTQNTPYPYGYAETNQMQFQPPNILQYQQHNFIPDEFMHLVSAFNTENTNLKEQLMIAYRTIWELKSNIKPRQTKELIQTAPNTWGIKLSTGKIVPFAQVNLFKRYIVNVHPNGTFDAIFMIFNVNGQYINCVIPYKELMKNNVEPYLRGIIGHPADSNYHKSYVVNIFYNLISSLPNNDFINIPRKQGWNMINGQHLNFIHIFSFPFCLADYFNLSTAKRILIPAPATFNEIKMRYSAFLPQHWKYKLLVTIRTASILLYFFRKENLKPVQFFIIEPANNINADAIKSLLLTSYDEDLSVPSLSSNTKDIKNELDTVNDGTVLFQDNFLNNERTGKFNSNIEAVNSDINANNPNQSRHIISILSSNPTSLPYNLPARFLSFNDADLISDETQIKKLHLFSNAFDSALINQIKCNPQAFETELFRLIDTYYANDFISDMQYNNTVRIIMTSARLLSNFGILNNDDIANIIKWLDDDEDWTLDSANAIINDFEKTINQLIHSGELTIVKQDNFISEKMMAFETKHHINFEKKVLKELICPKMNTTHQITKIFSAYQSFDKSTDDKKMYGTNGHRRNLKINSSQTNVSVYSFSKNILDNESMEILYSAVNKDFLYPINNTPTKNFVPVLLSANEKLVAGIRIDSDSDENFHTYISGQTRSGKSFFLAQQAVSRAYNGDKVIIFDQDGSFSEKAIQKVFKENAAEIEERYISRYDVSKTGIPVNLFTLAACSNNTTKKDRIKGILTAGIKSFGENQNMILGKAISELLKSKSLITPQSISEQINSLSFEEKKVISKLLPILKDIEEISMSHSTWKEILYNQKSIITISTNEDSMKKSTILIDMMLSSLYNYKVSDDDSRITVIIDELRDHNLTKESPIHTMMRKGNKHKLHMLVASQEFPKDKSILGTIAGYAGMRVYFQQKEDCLSLAEKRINNSFEISLKTLCQHFCVIDGNFFNSSANTNTHAVFYGKSADFGLTSYSKSKLLSTHNETEYNLDSFMSDWDKTFNYQI